MIAELAGIQAEAAAVQEFCRRTGASHAKVKEELDLCMALGNVDFEAAGFVGYFRCRASDEPLIRAGNIEALRRLPHELRHVGELLFVVILLAVEPGFGYRAGRRLSRLPGVKRLLTYTKGRWRTRRVVWGNGSKTQ